VSDTLGEWLELYNAGGAPVNLAGWSLGTHERSEHVIAADLWIEPGAYVVLARHDDPEANGGVVAAYRYSGVGLANTTDSVVLRAPDGSLVDAVAWDAESSPTVQPGASLERANLAGPAQWVVAAQPWPGSAGDFGSPGAPFAPPLPTPTPIFPTPHRHAGAFGYVDCNADRYAGTYSHVDYNANRHAGTNDSANRYAGTYGYTDCRPNRYTAADSHAGRYTAANGHANRIAH
jgi:hypothetical protein